MEQDMQLVEQRQEWLLERLESQRRVMTTDVAAELDVSVDTIRRDLRSLHDRGFVRRVHGGAVPIARLPNSFTARSREASWHTSTLAAAVVKRFRPGDVIGLDGGTTCVDIAAQIPATLSITIITNNPAAAVSLADHPHAKVILLGGDLDLTWMTTTGADTVDSWRNYRLDIGVLGICGIDSEAGMTTNSANEVATKRALISSSSDVIVPVHHDKVGVRGSYVVADLDALDIVISTSTLTEDLQRTLSSSGREVTVTS